MRDYAKEALKQFYTADDRRKAEEEEKFIRTLEAEEKKGYSHDEAFSRTTLIVKGIDPDAKDEEPEDTRTNSEIFTDIMKGFIGC